LAIDHSMPTPLPAPRRLGQCTFRPIVAIDEQASVTTVAAAAAAAGDILGGLEPAAIELARQSVSMNGHVPQLKT
jgi:hypothetical protein